MPSSALTIDASEHAIVGHGPLHVLETNPRYFSDDTGRAILLVGSHTWDNRQDIGRIAFNWAAYLDALRRYDHSFVRLWMWEQPRGLTTWPQPVDADATIRPELFVRSGPGTAADGGLRFDLAALNNTYIHRLRDRVVQGRDRGVFVSIMLFDGWSVDRKGDGINPWPYHPFNLGNNANGINGDPAGTGIGTETHTLHIPAVTRLQEQYVRTVVDAVSDLDNVLFEISNESYLNSRDWQYHFIDFVRSLERDRPKQHPIGMTALFPEGGNVTLFDSRADWIAPDAGGGYKSDPPAATGSKVIIADTDHLWGIGGKVGWAWKCFTRGYNLAYMDPWQGEVIRVPANEGLRRNFGYIRQLSERLPLADMKPSPALASTGYCLARQGSVYLVYVPSFDEWRRTRLLMPVSRRDGARHRARASRVPRCRCGRRSGSSTIDLGQTWSTATHGSSRRLRALSSIAGRSAAFVECGRRCQ